MDNDFDKVKIRDRLVPGILIAVDLHLSRGAELGFRHQQHSGKAVDNGFCIFGREATTLSHILIDIPNVAKLVGSRERLFL